MQDEVNRGAIREERHILNGEYARDDPLVPVTACQFVAHADLALLRDADTDAIVHAWGQLVASITREHFDLDDLAPLAMWNAQRAVSHLTPLFSEDGSEQLFLSG